MSDHDALPRTRDVPPLPQRWQRLLRKPARRVFGTRWDLHLHDEHHVPADGPVLVAPNHVGYLDGPLLVGICPRPVHAMVKAEMFHGAVGRLLDAVGQIPLDRYNVDAGAVKLALRALRDGRAVAIYPEGERGSGDVMYAKRGVAYLALVTGAPVVPVATFGTRLPGTSVDSVPGRGRRLDVVYGPPIPIEPVPWPRRADVVGDLTRRLQGVLAAHVADSAARLGVVASPSAIDSEGPEPGSLGYAGVADVHEDGHTDDPLTTAEEIR